MEKVPPFRLTVAMDDLAADFVCEATETLGGLQAAVARLAADRTDRVATDALMRRLHGLKGLCGFAQFRRAEALVHAGEDLAAALIHTPASSTALASLSRVIERLADILAYAALCHGEPEGDDADLLTETAGAAARLRITPAPVFDVVEALTAEMLPDQSWPEVERRSRAPWTGLDTLAQALGDQLGKRITLMVGGDDVRIAPEASRPLRLALIALVRNACDHGVESLAERRAAAKPPLSLLRLSVHRCGEGAIIELADDGRGVDPEFLKAHCIASGRLDADEAAGLDARAAQELVFATGLSTAATVDEISGRGLGLALVRAELEALGGHVSLSSTPGQGARFVMVLPAAAVATPAARGRAAAA